MITFYTGDLIKSKWKSLISIFEVTIALELLNQIITVHSHVLVNTVLTFPDMQDINILLTNQDHQRAIVTFHLRITLPSNLNIISYRK